MKRYKLADFTKGWFIGSFQPTLYQTSSVEVGVKYHTAGEDYGAHYQKIATEYNVMVEGRMKIGEEWFTKGDIFVIPPGEIVKPHFYTDCVVVVVKIPSINTDKVEV